MNHPADNNPATNFIGNFLYENGELKMIYHPDERKEACTDGLSISGIGSDYDDYLNKYTSKELQLNGCWAQARALTDMNPNPSGTGEFGSLASSSGLEMFDFHARFYDPALGHPYGFRVRLQWFVPDPATAGNPYWTEQFANPYLAMGNNPAKTFPETVWLMYVDPDGEFIMTAIVIGAFVNLTIQTLQGNTTTAGGFFGSFAIGAVAGAASAGAGAAVSGVVGGIGAASGFAGGFVTGSGNSYLGGANFGEGLMDGVKTGAIGAGTGAVVGGLASGIDAISHGGNFWSGKGAIYESKGSLSIKGKSKPVEYSTKSAKEFSNTYLKEPKGLNDLYADGRIPSGRGYTVNGNVVLNPDGDPVQGLTVYLGNRQSNVYLFKSAFSSHEQLYLVMQHEYLHVAYNYNGLMNYKKQEARAREWMLDQGKAWNYKVSSLENIYHGNPWFSKKYHYSRFGVKIRNQTPW